MWLKTSLGFFFLTDILAVLVLAIHVRLDYYPLVLSTSVIIFYEKSRSHPYQICSEALKTI